MTILTSETPVAVVGATGRTGRLIVTRLLEDGTGVRALIRDAAKAREILPDEVVRFVADVRVPESLFAPIAGAAAVIIATSPSPQRDNSAELVDYHGTRNLVSAALAGNVELIVFISTIYTTRPEHYADVESTSLGWKARAEEAIRDSTIPYCIIRPGWLTDHPGGDPLLVAQGDTAEGHISRTDLANTCVEVLSLPQARGKTFELIAAPTGHAGDLDSAIAALRPDPTPTGAVRPGRA